MTHVIAVKGNGIGTNCKITTYSDKRISYSFGNGRNNYCLTASYDPDNPDMIYIDRVEKSECIINMKIEDIQEGTAKLVRLALYTLYQAKPDIKRLTLKDDSYIYCSGISGPKISISYDYILKYNQTWYQKKFGALLPGFISIGSESHGKAHRIDIDGVKTTMYVDSGSPMDIYLTSLSNLDKPCMTYDEISEKFSEIKKHRIEYESSISPRDFMNKLRKKYNNNYDFCMEGDKWFKRYIEYLQIKIFYDLWYIPVSAIQKPTNYEITEPSAKNKLRILQGGKRNNTKKLNKRSGIMSFSDESGLGLTWNDVS